MSSSAVAGISANLSAEANSQVVQILEDYLVGLEQGNPPTPDSLLERYPDLTTVLRPGGQFVTFAYHAGTLLPAGRRFKKLLPRYFSSVEKSPTVWRNAPPAFVYRCRR